MKWLLFFVLLLLVLPGQIDAAELYNTGFRTLGIWLQDSGMRLDLNLWYPTLRKTQDHNFMPWVLPVALNAKIAAGTFPLLVLSHASPGNRFTYSYLASELADNGYIVIAPYHRTDSMDNMDDMFTWPQLDKRVTELGAAVDIALGDPDLREHIDVGKIGFIGFGTGATAGILLAGGMPNCDSWPRYCRRAGPEDPYCTEWSREKIDQLCSSLPPKSLQNSHFKAFALIAPAYGMLFDAKSFSPTFPPVLLVGAGKDSFNRPELHCEPLARILGKNARYLNLPQADAGALMNSCPAPIEAELPELCKSVEPAERKKIHARLENALRKFFDIYLK